MITLIENHILPVNPVTYGLFCFWQNKPQLLSMLFYFSQESFHRKIHIDYILKFIRDLAICSLDLYGVNFLHVKIKFFIFSTYMQKLSIEQLNIKKYMIVQSQR